MKHTPVAERNEKIFLALTKIYRDIRNGKTKIAWHKTFEEQGMYNPNCVTLVKNTLQKMNIIKIHRDATTTWNSAYTSPSPTLVKGILLFAKTHKEDSPATKVNAPKIKESIPSWTVTTTWGTFGY